MEISNKRKRQLVDDTSAADSCKKLLTVKEEPNDHFDKGDHPSSSATPILSSMIATPSMPSTVVSNDSNSRQQMNPTDNYLTLFTAFRQFLHRYLQAGGDANLASSLANYAAALLMSPSPLKPLMSLSTMNSFSQKMTSEEPPTPATISTPPATKVEMTQKQEPEASQSPTSSPMPTLSSALGEYDDDANRSVSPTGLLNSSPPDIKPSFLPMIARFPVFPILQAPQPVPEATSEIQRLREAAFGRYKNVLCVICNEWICSRNRKNHIVNYRPYNSPAYTYARCREVFVVQHIKSQHKGDETAVMLSAVDLHVSLEVDRIADECVTRTRRLIENMQEKKDGDFGENKDFDEKALELMMAEEAEKKVVVIESVSEVRPKVANYHRRQRTKVLKKIYDTDAAKQAELKIVKDEDGAPISSITLEEGFEIKLEDLLKMVEAVGGIPGSGEIVSDEAGHHVNNEDAAVKN